MELIDQGLVGHPIVLGRTPAKVFQVGALPIERLFLPCKALPPTSLPLAQVAKTFLVVLHTGCLAFLMEFQQGSVSNSCEMVKVGLLFAWQTLAGVKPGVGCVDWVHDDELFSVEVCSFEMHVKRLIHTSSYRDVVVWETFVKVDGMYDSCRNIRS